MIAMFNTRMLAETLSRLVSTIASIAVVVIVLLVVTEVALRSTIGFSLGFVEEIVSYLVVAVTFFGACVSFRKQAFFKVGFFYNKLSRKVKKVFDVAHSLIALLFCIPLFYFSIFLVISSYTRKTAAPTLLGTPLFIPQLIIPVGMALLIFFVVEFGITRLSHPQKTPSVSEETKKEES